MRIDKWSPKGKHLDLLSNSLNLFFKEITKWSPKRKHLDLLCKSLKLFFEEIYRDQFGELVCWYWGLKGQADFVKNTCRHFTHSIPVSQDEKWGRGTESNFIQITIFCSAKPRVDAFVTALFKNTWILKLKKPAAVLRFSLLSIISADLLGNRILLWRVQKVTVCDLWLANFDPFCVFLCFKVRCLWSWW